MTSNASQQLQSLKEEIEASDITPELKSQATQLVFGSGNSSADVVFIGEAPGKKEDETGEPFVGAAGKFLNEMLASIGMNREDVYITNIVKYRPPNNRDPSPEEKKAFLPYLQAQLEILQPKVVVTLGRHSGTCFLPDLQISKDHGQPKRINLAYKTTSKAFPVVVLPLYHPAAALYNGGLRTTLVEDFGTIPLVVNSLEKS